MKGRRLWEIGGFISGAILIVFGAVALYLGINGYQTVGDELSKEYIVGGSDMAPTEIQKAASEAGLPASITLPTCNVVDESIDTGTEALLRAIHARPRARGDGRPELRADGALPVGSEP
jgi:hypothetical protein